MIGPSLKARIFLKLLKNTKGGSLSLTLPDGKVEHFGDGPTDINLRINQWSVIDDLLDKGDLGLAEAIIEGSLEVDNVVGLVEWACRNDEAMERMIHGTWYGTMAARLRRFLTENSRRGAKKNIMAHYDLGNDFYRLWLDQSMTYSSAIYSDKQTSLEQAQLAKYDRIIDQLGIKSSDHVLEIGCGWGGFFSRAVERTGCKVTAVMNSPAQAQHNRDLIARRGFADHVDLRQVDYRDIEGRYDKIVSIEMIEAVGEKYWGSFFDKVSSSLKTGGQSLIQSITIQDHLFDSYRSKTDFIQRYVFPGGMLLSPKVFEDYGAQRDLRVAKPFEFGISYAETLQEWRKNFEQVEKTVLDMGFDDKFMRMWKLYLSYCEGAFRAERINVGHYLLEK